MNNSKSPIQQIRKQNYYTKQQNMVPSSTTTSLQTKNIFITQTSETKSMKTLTDKDKLLLTKESKTTRYSLHSANSAQNSNLKFKCINSQRSLFVGKDVHLQKCQTERRQRISKKQNKYFSKLIDGAPEYKRRIYNDNDSQFTKYFHSYKKLDYITQSNSFFQKHSDLYSQMLEPLLQDQSLLPKRIGILNSESDDNFKEISVKNQGIGQVYSPILCQALRHDDLQHIERLDTSKNNLRDKSIEGIIPSISRTITNLNLSSNKFGLPGIRTITQLFDSKNYNKLKKLNLERNQITDVGVNLILTELQNNITIKILNLSYNLITEQGMIQLKNLLEKSLYLQELYLKWNKISSGGVKLISEGLENNNTLAVLDLSHNGLGNRNIFNSLLLIKTISKEKSGLRHLDISFNGICQEETVLIAQMLENNHSLYGFHFMGNGQALVDARGHLIIQQQKVEFNPSQQFILSKKIVGISIVESSIQSKEEQDICWICSGWVEHKFEFNTHKLDQKIKEGPIFLHLSFENFEPILMEQDYGNFYSYRMLPPFLKVYYFFTQPALKIIDIIHTKHPLPETNYLYDQQKIIFKYKDGYSFEGNYPKKFNVVIKENRALVIDDQQYESLVTAVPRDDGDLYNIIKPKKIPWSFNTSFFKDCKFDTDELENDCFEFDWNCSRITSIVKKDDDLRQIKQLLYENYKKIRMNYKYLSSLNLTNDIFSINLNTLTEYLSTGSIIDGKNLKLRDLDLQFVVTNTTSAKKQNLLQPERSLVRYQFLEILVRLACNKYMQSGEITYFVVAFRKFLEEGMSSLLARQSYIQEWRDKRYWTKECDLIIRQNLDFFKTLYKQYEGTKREKQKTFTTKKFMNLGEFIELWKYLDLFDDLFSERDTTVCFNYAIEAQVNELENDRHLQMGFVEFVEAFSRIAEKFSPIPMDDDCEMWQKFIKSQLKGMLQIEQTKIYVIKQQISSNQVKKCEKQEQLKPKKHSLRPNLYKKRSKKLFL